MTIQSIQRKIFGSNETLEKVKSCFFRTEYSKRTFEFHFFKTIFDTVIRPSRLFSGKWNRFVQMVNAISGRNLPVLKFAYQLLKPWTAFHQPVPFTKKRPRKPEDWYQLRDITNGTRIFVWNIHTGKTELPFQTEVFRCKDPKSCVPFTFPLDFPETF